MKYTITVLRGGSWFNIPRNLHLVDRYSDTPDNRRIDSGFRLVRTNTSEELNK